MSDLIKKLRGFSIYTKEPGYLLMRLAADEIERLTAENKDLVQKDKPDEG